MLQTANNNESSPLNINHIPGRRGLPLIGHSLKLVYSLDEFADYQHKHFGEVSRAQALGGDWLVVVGADNWQKILLDNSQLFSCAKGYETTLAEFYAQGLLMRDFEDHKIQRRIMQQSFKNESMKAYVADMAPIINQHVDSFDKGSKFVFGPAIKQTLLDVGAKVFIGLDVPCDNTTMLNKAFSDIGEGLIAMIRAELPGTSFAKGKKGMRRLHQFLRSEIASRRTGSQNDMFSHMCQAKMEDDAWYTDDDIVAHAAFLLFAAHDTTTSTLHSIALYTAQNPEWQDKMREEVLALDKEELEYEDLDKLEVIDRVIHECLRLIPAAPLTSRATTRDCEMGGYQVPANTKILLPVTFNHRDPAHWSDPMKFDPDRFLPERAEHKNHPFCYHPFGGGAHKCIGLHFANMLAKAFLFKFLKTYQYSLPTSYEPNIQWAPLPKPTKLPLELKRISV